MFLATFRLDNVPPNELPAVMKKLNLLPNQGNGDDIPVECAPETEKELVENAAEKKPVRQSERIRNLVPVLIIPFSFVTDEETNAFVPVEPLE